MLALPYYAHFMIQEKLIAAEQEMELKLQAGQCVTDVTTSSKTVWQLE